MKSKRLKKLMACTIIIATIATINSTVVFADTAETQTLGVSAVNANSSQTQGKYVITFNSNGGDAYSQVAYGGDDGTVLPTVNPTNAGMEFYGWYTSADGGKTLGKKFTPHTEVKENMTVYARWVVEENYINPNFAVLGSTDGMIVGFRDGFFQYSTMAGLKISVLKSALKSDNGAGTFIIYKDTKGTVPASDIDVVTENTTLRAMSPGKKDTCYYVDNLGALTSAKVVKLDKTKGSLSSDVNYNNISFDYDTNYACSIEADISKLKSYEMNGQTGKWVGVKVTLDTDATNYSIQTNGKSYITKDKDSYIAWVDADELAAHRSTYIQMQVNGETGSRTLVVNFYNTDAPQGLIGVAPNNGNNGKITGLELNKSYEYKLDTEQQYKPIYTSSYSKVNDITGLAPGKYQVRYAQMRESFNGGKITTVTVPAR